jgi:hypothetical protein
MDTNGHEFISLVDLGMAYRKAKADLFYSSRACRKTLSAFESKLREKLTTFQKKLAESEAPSISGKTWTLVPKGIKDNEPETDLISSNPQHLWNSISKQANDNSRRVQAEFRLMEKLSIEFHVFSAFWINKIGHKFEERLTSSVRGNRLRRKKDGEINILSLGSTVPYLHAYCKWRDGAFVAMENALEDEKSVVAITADVRSFYHKLDVRFMLNDEFINGIGVELNDEEMDFHTLFINALHEWAEKTPLNRGLPVGLTASSVIANVALFELDLLFEREIVPLYYGRYVDDIILVMENGANFTSSVEIWDWLIERMKGSLSWKGGHDKKELLYKQTYLEDSEIIFANDKNKTFLLSGSSGYSVLRSIRHEVQARTSEWRALPDLPGNSTQLESMLLTAIQRDGISADSLRKADKVSVRRAGFALKLRDIEAYARALSPDEWQKQRHAFLTAFIRHVLVLPTFFDFFNYLSRILMLTVSCGDFIHLRRMLDAVERILAQLEGCDNCIKAQSENKVKKQNHDSSQILVYFRENLKKIVRESIECAFPLRVDSKSKKLWRDQFQNDHSLYPTRSIKEIQAQHKRYMKRDLAYRPLKILLLPPALSGLSRSPIARKYLGNLNSRAVSDFLQDAILEGCRIVSRLVKVPGKEKTISGLLFPTRPLGIHDLYLLHTAPFTQQGSTEIAKCLLALRGFNSEGHFPVYSGNKPGNPIEIPHGKNSQDIIRIAVTSWKTDMMSWTASISRHPEPDASRLGRLNHLLNSIIQCRKLPGYLILPELSIPANWFLAIAGKLQKKGISLICGIEYLHASRRSVHNQVWAALSHDALGFPATMIYRQDKQHPALHEEQELHRISGKTLRPQLKPWASPPLINHGGFQFAILVCSELTNVAYRSALRGKIDALFVPEWNQDTLSFNALVESAALDIHSYVIQCNDRKYGDSRIRAPYKDNWMRDIVRIKGGIEDYFVTGEIDIQSLRAFQSSHRSPDKPYKPVPDGFEMAHDRKILPSGKDNA